MKFYFDYGGGSESYSECSVSDIKNLILERTKWYSKNRRWAVFDNLYTELVDEGVISRLKFNRFSNKWKVSPPILFLSQDEINNNLKN